MNSTEIKAEILILCEDILADVELTRIPLTNIALKASRVARLLEDFESQKVLSFEASGYPVQPSGFSQETWNLIKIAGRNYFRKNPTTKEEQEYGYGNSIEELENLLDAYKKGIEAARDPDVSVASANPKQYVSFPVGNRLERNQRIENIRDITGKLSQRRNFIYQYIIGKYYELKYSEITENIFDRYSKTFKTKIETLIPEELPKFTSIYDNLSSENPEDWANAVHSCRRLLQGLADVLFPVTSDKSILVNGKEKIIKLGKDNYINRLIEYINQKSSSERFQELIGSDLSYIGNRLDSVFQASQKGSHSIILKEEADRYVIHTFFLLGDILSL
ncbi:hypothetical protein [Leptospira yasudae]|uniref:AbiTii domain-containing protein n=1 Tax=Leptospira yasudae TaxID=2202201 RepID=UPI0013146D19|nr:hypothetical protein [Leptospira yasudae]